MELWELAAREHIRDTLARYNWSGDALRLDELAQTFCEDGELELRGRGPVRGRAAIVELLGGAVAAPNATAHASGVKRIVRHNVTNIRFADVTRKKRGSPATSPFSPRSASTITAATATFSFRSVASGSSATASSRRTGVHQTRRWRDGRLPCMSAPIDPSVPPSGTGCAECDAVGGWWVHLRRCAACGHIGCCDDSLARHASAHWRETGHPIIRSFEPGEDWFWNFDNNEYYDGPELAAPESHPKDQDVPGPAGRVPQNWVALLRSRGD